MAIRPRFSNERMQEFLQSWEKLEAPIIKRDDMMDCFQAEKAVGSIAPEGLALRFVSRSGAHLDVMLNPVAAAKLAELAFSSGDQGGWIEGSKYSPGFLKSPLVDDD